jgi:hypothetical protein
MNMVHKKAAAMTTTMATANLRDDLAEDAIFFPGSNDRKMGRSPADGL